MQSTRKRKPLKPLYRNIVDEDKQSEKQSLHQYFRQLLFWLVTKKVQLALLFLILLLYSYVSWPPPKLSKHAQHWRDSSYVFKYHDKQIFYQDILSLKRPVKMHPVLLILHGFPTSGYDWRNLIKGFQRRFGRIIIPDFLGFGFSDKPIVHAYSIKEQATIIEDIVSSLNVTDVHVLAHDYGDSVAQELLARSSEPGRLFAIRIRSLCLTNGGILPDNHKPLFIQKLLLVPVLNGIISRLVNMYIFSSRLQSIFGDSKPTDEDMNDFWSIARHKDGNLASPGVLQYLNERQDNKNRWVSALQHTTIPLHLIYGPQDPINTPELFLSEYEKLVPNSGVSVLEGTGHYPQLENKVGFIKFYNKFLKRIERDFYEL